MRQKVKGCLALCLRCMHAMKTCWEMGQVIMSLRVMEFQLHGTCWKSLLKASQEVQWDSTTEYHIWGRTSLGLRVSDCNCMSYNKLPLGPLPSTRTHTHPLCCQLTPLAPPAPVLRCPCLLSAGASLLCCRLLVVLLPPVVHRCIHLCLLPCLHLLSHLCLAWHPLFFSWLSHFPEPQPLPLVAPLPGTSTFTIHHTSTFHHAPLVQLVVVLPSASTPISSQLRLVPRPPPLVAPLLVTAFGIVCCCSCHRFCPMKRFIPQGGAGSPQTLPLPLSLQRRASFAVAVAMGHPHACPLPAQSFSCHCPCRAHPLPGHGSKDGVSPNG